LSAVTQDAGEANGEPLEPEQAFQLASQIDGNTVHLRWTIAPHHYLYRDKVSIQVVEPSGAQAQFTLAQGEEKNDAFLGKVRIFHDVLELSVKLPELQSNQKIKLNVGFQGCAEAGICYPPMEQLVELTAGSIVPGTTPAASSQPSAQSPLPPATAPPLNEQDAIAEKLKSGNTWLAIGLFFLAGLGLALTPCIFPMIPILSGIIAGQGENGQPLSRPGLRRQGLDGPRPRPAEKADGGRHRGRLPADLRGHPGEDEDRRRAQARG